MTDATRPRPTRARWLLLAWAAIATLAIACAAPQFNRTEVAGGGGPSTDVAPSGPASAPATAGQRDAAAYSADSATALQLPAADGARLLIRTGSMDLVVRSVPETLEATRQAVTALGGLVADSTVSGGGKARAATLTLRVPADRFAEAMTRLEDLAVEVLTSTTGSRDVTEELTDLDATLRNLRAVEAQYQQILGRANTLGEVVQVQERLNHTRLQVDRTEARRKLLASQVEMASLSVTLRAEVAAVDRLERLGQAWQGSFQLLDTLATGAMVALVYGWWMLLVGGALLWMLVRLGRRLTLSPRAPQAPAS